MNLKQFSLISCLCSLCFTLCAQVKTNFNSNVQIDKIGYFSKLYKTVIDIEIPAKNLNELLFKEKIATQNFAGIKPFEFAVAETINLNIAKLTNWIIDGDNSFGKYCVKLNGALSAGINFDNFFLPAGTEMYVYNENGHMITGAITENENNANKAWGSWVYQGQYITIEIKTPTQTRNNLVLHANNLAYGYKEIYKNKTSGFGQSGACNINVLCPLGIGWEAERNSVGILMSSNGTSFCTGSMVMNTCNSSRPFFLTANHCYAGDNVGLWRFGFQGWSPTCSPSQNSDGIIFNGSTLKANWAPSDFCLVELNNTPAATSGINYSGWNKSATPATKGMGIHHPAGDVMKISEANNPVIKSGYYTSTGVTHWKANWTQAVTEGGSSGSPLYDQNHKIIGQLHGGPSACNSTQLWDYYGCFDISWIGGGTATTGLSAWLDPANTGAITTNTTTIASLAGQAISITSQPNNVNTCQGTSASFAVAVSGAGTTYQWQSSPQGCAGVFTDIFSATAQAYTIANISNALNGYAYRVKISGTCATASVISNCATLNINSAVAITNQPASVNICLGNATSFNTVATGVGITYQWQISTDAGINFTNIPNANSLTYNVNNVAASMNGYQYKTIITNACGTVGTISNIAILTVTTPIAITLQPLNVTTCATTTTLNVSATGSTLTYQWQLSTDAGVTFNNIAGANLASFVLSNLTGATSKNKYRVVVSNAVCAAVVSNSVMINVGNTPTVFITAAPYFEINPSHTTSLSTSINPTGNYFYQWKRNNEIIPVFNASIIGLNGKQNDFGTYQLTATDAASGCKGISNSILITDIEAERNKLFIWPNPTKGIVQISYYSNEATQNRMINVYDEKGSRVMSKAVKTIGNYGSITLDISSMSQAVYLIELTDAGGNKIKSGRIVKQ